jgi:hypothetical protein
MAGGPNTKRSGATTAQPAGRMPAPGREGWGPAHGRAGGHRQKACVRNPTVARGPIARQGRAGARIRRIRRIEDADLGADRRPSLEWAARVDVVNSGRALRGEAS